jgi:hypothetical protein
MLADTPVGVKRLAETAFIQRTIIMLCLRSEDAFVITCVANLMEVKVLYVQQDLRYEISRYWECLTISYQP